MSRDRIKDTIVEIVNHGTGCKAPELISLITAHDPSIVSLREYREVPALIAELVKENRIVEVEYILPTMDYRVKSMLFPAGTKLHIVNQG